MPRLSLLPVCIASLLTISQAARIPLSKRDSPVLSGYTADPHMAIFDKTYYIYPTDADGDGKEYHVWKSDNLVNWTRKEEPILKMNQQDGEGNVPWADGAAWAPAAIERDGKYYLYHSETNPSHDGAKNIGVAVADSPEGPFTGQSEPMIFNTEDVTTNDAIDPMAFFDPVSKKYYLYWGNGGCLHADLNDDMVSINKGTIGAFPALTGYSEAPFVVYRDGIYHMTYSIALTWEEDYRVGYATSTSPIGPWEYRGVILEKRLDKGIKGTGHQAMVNIPGTDDWYIAYHRFAIPDGDGTRHRETCIDRVTFDPDTGFIQKIEPTISGVGEQIIE